MQGHRIALANRRELGVGHAAVTHIVLGMHLEEADIGRSCDDRAKMLRLQADAGTVGSEACDSGSWAHGDHLICWKGRKTRGRAGRPLGSRTQLLIGSSAPLPCGVAIAEQVPLGTSLNDWPS